MDDQNYSNYSNQLASATNSNIFNPPQLDDITFDNKRFLKNTLEGVGSTFVGHSVVKSLEKNKGKASKVLKQLGVSDEDMKELQAKIENGDYEGATRSILKGASKKITNQIEQKVKSTVGDSIPNSKQDLSKAGKRLARRARRQAKQKLSSQEQAGPAEDEPTSTADIKAAMDKITGRISRVSGEAEDINPLASKLGKLPLRRGANLEEVLKEQYGNIKQSTQGSGKLSTSTGRSFDQEVNPADRPKAPYGQQQKVENPESSTKSNNPTEDANVDANAEQDALKLGQQNIEKNIEKKTIDSAFEDSVADDENPLGIAITAALGIGALVAGIRTKDHVKKFVATPIKTTLTNYSNQSGVV